MAEALGVAGSVAGIVSLGIQLTQGLLKYYGSWKDQDNDISDMCASLDSLRRTLIILSETIQPPARFGMSIKNSVEKNVNRINGALEQLKDELRKVQGTEPPKPGTRSVMRRHVRRALYPFREETLSKIQRVVSEARSNLDLALQVLQVGGISDIRHEVNLLVRWQEGEETQNILGWLSSVNFWLKQADVSNQKQTGTGQWLLAHPDFLEWAKGNKETVWCLGSPGVGKTVLASVVIEFLENDLPVRGIGLTFIYCNHKENLLQRIEYFIGAIVRQLVERRQAIPTDVRTLYEKHRGKGTTPTCAEYLELLQSLTKECSEVYIVIDALDECIDKKGQIIWNDLLTKLGDTVSNLRLLCTSRHIDDVAGILAGSTRIKIRASEPDIRAYVQAQIKSKYFLFEFCRQDSNLQNDILQEVVTKAEGMFLAARLYVESLASKTNLRAVKRVLRELPATLDDNYNEAMERIKQQPTKVLAMRALSWIVYAVRPLQLEEFLHAIAIDDLEPDDRSISKEILTPQSIVVNACAGMIKIDEETNVVGLVHKTTQEYLERSGAEHFPDARRGIGIACLKYLSLDVFSEGYCSTDELLECRLKENTLLHYAARNVGDHIREETGRSLYDLALKFLLDKRKVSCASQVLFIVSEVWQSSRYSQGFPKDFHGVHYAAYFGLMDIIKLLFESPEVHVDSKDTYDRTPLSWAAERGHEAVVKLLLATEKVDVDSKDSKYGQTPLSWAAERRHEAVVKLLLATEKVDVESKDSKYGRTPLSWAAERGHEAVVKLLLATEKVDVESKDSKYGRTPLSLAAGSGHEAVVKLLLATEKVDVNSKDSYGRTPLSWAAKNGHEAVVKLLLATEKVDVDSKDSYGRTPLLWAAGSGHEAVVKLLLATEKDDVDSKDSYGQTPLLWAAGSGHEAVVKLLLATEKDDVDSKDSYGRTPLSWAAGNGYEAVVKLLLATEKVDVDSKDSYDQTPLSLAAGSGREAVVELLLATEKVDVDSKASHGRTPLSLAAGSGHEAVVKLLLATEKVDVNSKDEDGRTPLSVVAERGHEAVVKLLLAMEKVDVDSKDFYDQTPLLWAADRGHEAVVKLLLATEKVDVHSKDFWSGRTPLSLAAGRGQGSGQAPTIALLNLLPTHHLLKAFS